MNRPHVLYVTPIFGYPAFGGPRLRTYNTLRAMARRADISLYLTQQPDTPDRERARAHLLTFCRDVVFPDAPPRPPIIRRVARRLVPAAARAAIRSKRPASNDEGAQVAEPNPAMLAALSGWLEANRPDLIWLRAFGALSYDLIPLKDDAGIPVVLETESVWSQFILRGLPFESDPLRRERILREGQSMESVERSGAVGADVTIAVSEVDAAYFRELAPSPDRVMLLANAIDVDAYVNDHSNVQLKQPALLFAGTLSHGTANVDASVWLVDEVMPAVWQRRPEVHLYLVGRSPAPPILARRGSRVHVTGEVASIVPYMRASAAAVVPLRWESGTRFKILEAFACKTPVISTTLGAEGLEVEHGEHLLLADDTAGFAAAILRVLDEPALGKRLAEPAYQLVRQAYDLGTAEHQIGAILDRLCASPSVGALSSRAAAGEGCVSEGQGV
jgi:polysaccharide biosynthesis protein PslH